MDAKRIAELERFAHLDDRINELLAALRASEAKLAVAVEVLRWYAEPTNCDTEHGHGFWYDSGHHDGELEFEPDHGERARTALAKIAEGGDGNE